MPYIIILPINFQYKSIHSNFKNIRVKWIIVTKELSMLCICGMETTQHGVFHLNTKIILFF